MPTTEEERTLRKNLIRCQLHPEAVLPLNPAALRQKIIGKCFRVKRSSYMCECLTANWKLDHFWERQHASVQMILPWEVSGGAKTQEHTMRASFINLVFLFYLPQWLLIKTRKENSLCSAEMVLISELYKSAYTVRSRSICSTTESLWFCSHALPR